MPNSDPQGRPEAAPTRSAASSPESVSPRDTTASYETTTSHRDDSSRRNPYATILRFPGAARFSVAAAIARLPMSMVGLAIVLIVEHTYGSYAAGGRVTAAYLIAAAIATPLIARLVDRHGQAKVMRPIVVINSTLTVALGLAIVNQAPEPVLWGIAAVVGATIGSFGALVRKRWTHVLDSPNHLHTAFSLESALDEFLFVIGPTLATILVVQVWPLAGLLVPAAGALIGGLWFCAQRASEPPAHPVTADATRGKSVLRNKSLLALSAIFLFIGVIFGSVEVSTVAFAKEAGRENLGGLILGVFAAGSMITGLAYGARHWRSTLVRRLTVTVTILAIGIACLLLAQNLWQLTLVLLVTGVAIAPTLITGNNIIHEIVHAGQLTEGLAWASTAMTIGVSVGTAVAGGQIDRLGAVGGYLISALGGAVALLLTYAAATAFRRRRTAVRRVQGNAA